VFAVNPTVQQSGSAGYTAFLVNPTETSAGSGTRLLTDLQVGGSSKFKVDVVGAVTATGPVTSQGTALANTANKNQANGYAGLDSSGKVPTSALNVTGTASDANEPISTAASTASSGYRATVTAGTTGRYRRGDKSWATLDKTAAGLGSVDNAAEPAKVVASAAKLTTARAINGVPFDGTGSVVVADATESELRRRSANRRRAPQGRPNWCWPTPTGGVHRHLAQHCHCRLQIIVKKVDSSVNAVTVAASGSDTFTSAGSGVATLSLPLQNQALTARYVSGARIVINTGIPLSQTDNRYAPLKPTMR
jgi:hypothetical protein